DKSDGIIKGLEFCYNDQNELYLTPGYLKSDGEYYFLDKIIKIISKKDFEDFDLKNESKLFHIILKKQNEEVSLNIKVKSFNIEISESIDKNDVFLGSFISRKNLFPVIEYKKLEDFSNSMYVDIRNRKYASKTKETISPKIIKAISSDLISIKEKDTLENYITIKGLDEEVVSLDLLGKYIGENIEKEDFKTIIEKLCNKVKISTNKIETVKNNFRRESSIIHNQTNSLEKM
ncbi:MAG: hypothetical protein ACRCZR_06155, partial [Cetobacterium sp.]